MAISVTLQWLLRQRRYIQQGQRVQEHQHHHLYQEHPVKKNMTQTNYQLVFVIENIFYTGRVLKYLQQRHWHRRDLSHQAYQTHPVKMNKGHTLITIPKIRLLWTEKHNLNSKVGMTEFMSE